QWNATDILVAVFFFVLLCTGLRFMLRTLGPKSYWFRVGLLYASFVFPLALVLMATSPFLFRRPLLLAPAALGALLVSFWPVSDGVRSVTWRAAAALILITALIAGAGRIGAQALDRTHRETAATALASIPPI